MLHHRRSNASVARLRKIIQRTQTDFAKMIGVSLDLIKGIETGRNQLTQVVAARIFVATGADVQSLLKGKGKVKYLHGGIDYRKEHFMHWTAHVCAVPNETPYAMPQRHVLETHESVIGPHMQLLLLAAARPMRGGRVRNRLASLLDSWAKWEASVIESFGLKPQIDEVIRECSNAETEWAGKKWTFAPGLHSFPDRLLKWLSSQRASSDRPQTPPPQAAR